jgi:heme/copper-type cytochrome/quinol oxidase subunit 2
MLNKSLILLIAGVVISLGSPFIFAQTEEANATTITSETSKAVEVGNKICPVSGEEIGEMGSAVQYEYKGKIYNFCCTGCIEEFKKAPEKYVKIVEEQMGPSIETGEENSHEGHHHMMGMDKDNSMMEHHQESMMSDKAQVKEINLEAYQFAFSPDTITVNKGDTVKIHATSRDVPHGVFIKEYGINKKVEKGKPADIEFVADKAGEFDILCSVYCGRGHQNMKGKLVVK